MGNNMYSDRKSVGFVREYNEQFKFIGPDYTGFYEYISSIDNMFLCNGNIVPDSIRI
jgi:hypothetical protein